MTQNPNTLHCRVCGLEVQDHLAPHLESDHSLTVAEYEIKFPGAPTLTQRLLDKFGAQKVPSRTVPRPPTELSIRFAGIEFPVNSDVPEDACLPIPPHYHCPRKGSLGRDVQHAAIALKCKRSLFVWGMPGVGKDALFHAWSWLTRTPAIIRQVTPGTDVESWFFSRGFNETQTIWEEGDVLKALRDGYVTHTGRRVPYLILITDFDRANRDQAEHIRLITDSIQGRVNGPAGKVYPVLPGTLIVATANTSGGGDERGRMISSNPIDASLLDRFERKVMFNYMSWEDEKIIVLGKFSDLFTRLPGAELQCRAVTKSLRDAVQKGDLHAEFSHRGLCSILGHACDIIACLDDNAVPTNLLADASRVWIDGLPDEETRLAARRLMDAQWAVL